MVQKDFSTASTHNGLASPNWSEITVGATVTAPGDSRPAGSGALWDIMKPFDAALFMRFMEAAGMTRTLEALPSKMEMRLNEASDGWIRDWLKLMDLYEPACVELELTASAATIRKLRAALTKPDPLSTEVNPLTIELGGRLFDEMGGRYFWSLNVSEAAYYTNPRKGWEEIIERFPDAAIDVEEASKCFALSRYAAAIFHSLHVVEIGLIELGKLIGVTDPLPGWSATTNRLQNIIKKGHEARTPIERQHFAFLEQMHGTVEGLKNAWRNKVSHAAGKLTLLTVDFSPDVTEEILFATRSFMRRLATDAPVVSAGQSS